MAGRPACARSDECASALRHSRAAEAARQRHCQTLWMWSVASPGSGRANAAQAAEAASMVLISSLKRETGAERVQSAARRGTRVRSGSHAEEAAAALHMRIPTPQEHNLGVSSGYSGTTRTCQRGEAAWHVWPRPWRRRDTGTRGRESGAAQDIPAAVAAQKGRCKPRRRRPEWYSSR
jgi:hypothetical protein